MKQQARTRKLFCIALFTFAGVGVHGQSIFKGYENLFTPPLSYVVHHTSSSIAIDGKMREAAWQQAEWTSDFTDIEGRLKPAPKYKTQVKMLWGDTCLYIAGRISEPQVWATLKRHDQVIFNDNDFEVFINPDGTSHHYFEIEFNALNTIFDLYLAKPYRNGGTALIPFDVSGMVSAVSVEGTLNKATDCDSSWTVEMAIPFRDLSLGDHVQIPHEGQLWRINFSRVEWDTKVEQGKYIRLTDSTGRRLPEHNWVWSPQGVVNMHYPERWGYLNFTKQSGPVAFILPYGEQQKKYLWLIYYKQKQWFQKHHRYAVSLKMLGLVSPRVIIDSALNTLSMEASADQFMVFVSRQRGDGYHIDQDGFLQQTQIVQ